MIFTCLMRNAESSRTQEKLVWHQSDVLTFSCSFSRITSCWREGVFLAFQSSIWSHPTCPPYCVFFPLYKYKKWDNLFRDQNRALMLSFLMSLNPFCSQIYYWTTELLRIEMFFCVFGAVLLLRTKSGANAMTYLGIKIWVTKNVCMMTLIESEPSKQRPALSSSLDEMFLWVKTSNNLPAGINMVDISSEILQVCLNNAFMVTC